MPRNNSKNRRDARRFDAQLRQQAYEARTPSQQIDRVLNRTGRGGTGLATKELDKLFAVTGQPAALGG